MRNLSSEFFKEDLLEGGDHVVDNVLDQFTNTLVSQDSEHSVVPKPALQSARWTPVTGDVPSSTGDKRVNLERCVSLIKISQRSKKVTTRA